MCLRTASNRQAKTDPASLPCSQGFSFGKVPDNTGYVIRRLEVDTDALSLKAVSLLYILGWKICPNKRDVRVGGQALVETSK